MMSLFPALLVGIALLGLLGDASLVTDAVRYAEEHGAPAEVTDALRASLTATIENSGGAVSGALVLGVLVAIYGASGAFGGAGRALNAVHGARETRSFVRTSSRTSAGRSSSSCSRCCRCSRSSSAAGSPATCSASIGLGDTAVASGGSCAGSSRSWPSC